VVEKRDSLKNWTILLAILAFGFSLTGTFIVRSGVLTSVHAFANDPERGVFILAILALFIGGALTLFAARSSEMEARGVFSLVSREAALVSNNILLAASALVVFIGTIWPLLAELAFDRKLSVGPPFFNQAFTPFVVALGLILPLGSVLPWKRARLGRVTKRLIPALVLALAGAGLVWTLQTGRSLLGPVGLFLGAWLVFGTLTELWTRAGRSHDLRRLVRLPRADWGKACAHAGLGVTIFGIAGMTAWQVEDIRVTALKTPWQVGAYTLQLDKVEELSGPNYLTTMGTVTLRKGRRLIAELTPEKRYYPVAKMPTTEAAIDYRIMRDVYVVLGDPEVNGGWVVRTYIKPLANWIWAGALLMAFGGLLSLSDKRLRVAAGATRTRPTVPAE
jgi:cytochrome c-type biogenesis protein CcmF